MTLRPVLPILTALIVPLAASLRGEHVLPADAPNAVYEGRCAVTQTHGVREGFPGVTLHLAVRGTSAALDLVVSKFAAFDLSVDGQPFREIQLKDGPARLELFSGAPSGVHTVELTRRTESWQGTCEVRSIVLDDSGELLPVKLPNRKMEFIGDSITCGSGVDRVSEQDLTDPMRSDARLSFGKLLAASLGTQCHLVSYGGRGVIRDWQGIRATNNAPQFYELSLPDEPSLRWDPARYVPDVIGICLSQNDFNQGIPDENEFVNAYVEFVRKVQRDAPGAVIILLDSPMQVDAPGKAPKRTVAAAYIDEVVAKVDSPRVRHVSLPHFPGGPKDSHPTAASQQAMAAFLEGAFRDALATGR